jgi:hypothetical protein
MDRGGRPYVDGDQSVGDRVMQLVRQTQALLVEAMDRRRLALSLGLVCPGFNQREAAVQGITGRQSSEQQRQTSQRRAERETVFAGDHDGGGDSRGHRPRDKQRAQAPSLKADCVEGERDDRHRRDVGVEHRQARQQPGCDDSEDTERIASAHDQRQRRGRGKDYRCWA